MFSNEVDRYDNKFLFFGGIGASLLAWMTTGSLWVLVGAIIIVSRECRRQELEQPQNVFDAAFQPLPLPAAGTPAPVTVNNAISTNVAVNLPAQAVPSINIPEVQSAPVPVATASTIVHSTAQGFNPASIDLSPEPEINSQELDVPKLIAENIHNQLSPGHLFMSCRTGSGKTFTIRATMRRMLELEPVQFIVVDPKGSQWLGLDPKCICRVRDEQDIPKLVKWCDTINKLLNKRIDKRMESGEECTEPRVILILDEWPTLWELAKSAKMDTQLLQRLNQIVRLGREDLINLWIVGQSHLVTESGFSRTSQNNFEMIALGRGEQMQSVRAMIADQWVVQDQRRRQQLLAELDGFDTSDGLPIAFVNASGGRLCKLPDLREFINWTIPKCEETNDGK